MPDPIGTKLADVPTCVSPPCALPVLLLLLFLPDARLAVEEPILEPLEFALPLREPADLPGALP